MLCRSLLFGLACLAITVSGLPSWRNSNDGIHLAIGPTCGSLRSTNTSDVNAGLLSLRAYKTIVSFGDSYTDGGIRNGSALLPPVLVGTNPKAGGRTTNGPVWIEDIANDTHAHFMDYAVHSAQLRTQAAFTDRRQVGGAVTNASLWPSKANASDFIHQVQLFLNESNTLDPHSTLYTVFFGINDWSASLTDGDKLPQAAQVIIDQIEILAGPPTHARSFLVTDDYGRGTVTATGEDFKRRVFAGLKELHFGRPFLKFAFVDFAYIWNAVLGPDPGYAAFGYTSPGACTLNSSTTIGSCSDPKHTFYWIPGHPSKETHRIMGDYVEHALEDCRVW